MTLPIAGYLSDSNRTNAEMKAAFEDQRNAVAELPGGDAEGALVISGGLVTPPVGAGGGAYTVDTEATAAADDLTAISQTNTPDGRMIMLRGLDAGRVVTIKNGGGGNGQILTSDGRDYELSPTRWILLKRRGVNWIEIDRPASGFIRAVQLTGSGTYTFDPAARLYNVIVVGGGGGGGNGGGGGGGGGFLGGWGEVVADSVGYTVGAGGAPGAAGGASSFGAITAGGGAAGISNAAGAAGGAGGSAPSTGGFESVPGQQGGTGGAQAVGSVGGSGGSSLRGFGGAGVSGNNGLPGTGYGGGGAGGGYGGSATAVARPGAAGAPGTIYVVEYS